MKKAWPFADVIVILGIMVALDDVLPTVTLDARAESFNVRPGAWEMTVTTVASGMKLSPELSAKMTPVQRAQMEHMIKSREGKPHTMTTQSCITKDDLSQDRIIKEMQDEDEDTAVQCKVKVLSKSPTKLVLDQLCPGPPSSTTHFTVGTKTTDSFVAIGERSEGGSGKAHIDIKGKWLRPDCDGLEE